MSVLLQSTDPADLPRIRDLVRDRVFRTNDISLDEDARTLVVPFAEDLHDEAELIERRFLGLAKKQRTPLERRLLRIGHVERHWIHDEAQIETQALSHVEFEAATVVVVAYAPTRVSADVEAFDISVEATGERMGWREVTMFPLGIESGRWKISSSEDSEPTPDDTPARDQQQG